MIRSILFNIIFYIQIIRFKEIKYLGDALISYSMITGSFLASEIKNAIKQNIHCEGYHPFNVSPKMKEGLKMIF
jgi:hypothetical protein